MNQEEQKDELYAEQIRQLEQQVRIQQLIQENKHNQLEKALKKSNRVGLALRVLVPFFLVIVIITISWLPRDVPEFSQQVKEGKVAYADVVSLAPVYSCVRSYNKNSLEASISSTLEEPNCVICSGKTTAGEEVWIMFELRDYQELFDSSASFKRNTSLLDHFLQYVFSGEEIVVLNEPIRVYGKVQRSGSLKLDQEKYLSFDKRYNTE